MANVTPSDIMTRSERDAGAPSITLLAPGAFLAVSSQTLMAHSYRVIRRMRYGTNSTRERHNDRGGPSSDTTQSREPEGACEALRRQPKTVAKWKARSSVSDLPTAHLQNFVDAYNFARRLKTLRGLTPYEFVRSLSPRRARSRAPQGSRRG